MTGAATGLRGGAAFAPGLGKALIYIYIYIAFSRPNSMNLQELAARTFNYWDASPSPPKKEPEKFRHPVEGTFVSDRAAACQDALASSGMELHYITMEVHSA